MKQSKTIQLVSVMFCFFAMGFVDLVGIASNYVKADLGLNDATANIFPSLVFFWFLIFSVPTGMLMNRIGRKKTVLLSLGVTAVSLLLPLFGENFAIMLLSFSLLGIGNALMQTSLNPLVTSITGGKNLASTLTFGQFVKAIASFLAPYIAMWGATAVIPSGSLGWRVLFVIYLVVGLLAALILSLMKIEESPVALQTAGQEATDGGASETYSSGKSSGEAAGKSSSFADCFRLLGKPIVLLSFLGIMCHVGIDVGTNATAPKLLIERLGTTLNEAAFATSLYFIFRTLGCLTGSWFLRVMRHRTFFIISVVMMALSMVGMAFGTTKLILYIAIALVGYGNSNIFSIVLSQALLAVPEKQNEISGLMIMGLFGGTVFPFFMGFASDAFGQIGAVAVMAVGVIYLFTYIGRVATGKN